MIWLCPEQVFDGEVLRSGMALGVSDRQIQSLIAQETLPDGAVCRPVKGVVTPGYLDLQVNGGGDAFLNTDPTPQGMETIAAAHRRFGTVGILPTLITDAPEVLDRAAGAAIAARGQRGILGIHIEGPHISIPRRGTHAERFVRPLDDRTLGVVRRLRDAGVTVMITLAPEAVRPGQIATLVGLGAVVSLGHTDTTAEATRDALAEGANCFTHLYNAMSPMLNRSAGVTGACINSTAFAGIICDGVHVADEMVGLALRARPKADTTFLVSDAMPTVGGSDHFTLYGDVIRVQDGRLVNKEGSLAGAHVTMAESVARIVTHVGLPLEQALRMAITVPARVIGAEGLAQPVGRMVDDLLVLGPDHMPRGTLAAEIG